MKGLRCTKETRSKDEGLHGQILYGYLYRNGGGALAKMLHAILSQRVKVTAVLVIY